MSRALLPTELLRQVRRVRRPVPASPLADSNRRPLPYHGSALPTELRGQGPESLADLVAAITRGEVLTLANQQRHVLLELPHELYFPLEPLLAQLRAIGVTGILSHPERNSGILAEPERLDALIDTGCLMQVTAGSLLGAFGAASQRLAEEMVCRGQAHFVASDGHGTKTRRPRLHAAFQRVEQLVDTATARLLCDENPRRVCDGLAVPIDRRATAIRHKRRWPWLGSLLRSRP